MRRNVSSAPTSKSTLFGRFLVSIPGAIRAGAGAWIFSNRSHGVLEGTSGGEVLAITDPTLDFFVLEFLFDVILLRLLVLAIFFPSHAWPEDDVFAHACRVERGTRRVTFFAAELSPGAPLGDTRIDGFLDNRGSDAAGGFHFFAVVVEAVGDDGFGAIFVRGDLLWREGWRIVELFVVGPVGAAIGTTCQYNLL